MLEPDSGLGGMRMSLEKTEQLRDLGRESCLKEASIGPLHHAGSGCFHQGLGEINQWAQVVAIPSRPTRY
jgi:hypothetical protein